MGYRRFHRQARPTPRVITGTCSPRLFKPDRQWLLSRHQTPERGNPEFEPTLKVSARDLGDAVEMHVRDNGTGIAPEIRDKLFQPFVTTKPTGEGTGLGLSIAHEIVTQQHVGTIEVDSQIGKFTEFTIRLSRRAVGDTV